MTSSKEIKEWLKPIQDPELQMSLVDLGLIYECQLDGDVAKVRMSLTSPACPAAGFIVESVRTRLLEHPSIENAEVELVWEPKWNPAEMASEEAKEVLNIW